MYSCPVAPRGLLRQQPPPRRTLYHLGSGLTHTQSDVGFWSGRGDGRAARELDAIDRALHAAAVLVGHLEEHAGALRF